MTTRPPPTIHSRFSPSAARARPPESHHLLVGRAAHGQGVDTIGEFVEVEFFDRVRVEEIDRSVSSRDVSVERDSEKGNNVRGGHELEVADSLSCR